MPRHVVLLTNAHEAPAATLTEVLRAAGVAAFVEGIREPETAPLPVAPAGEDDAGADADTLPPIAVLYEVVPGADMRELYSVIEHASAVWPHAPLVACRRPLDGRTFTGLRTVDAASLKRLGFRAIADEPAQLPALLRELEDRGVTGQLQLPEDSQAELLQGASLLPERLSSRQLRAAFELVASLHLANDQAGAANVALAGLAPLVSAERWAIYLTTETHGSEEAALEPLAVRGLTPGEGAIPEQDWQRALMGHALSYSGSESKAAREAVARMLPVRKTEAGRRFVAVPLISGDRVIGVLEGVREGEAGRRGFTRGSLRILEALAQPVAYALANSLRVAEAERLSQTDDLTKLHNARYLRQYLLSEVRRARRYGSSVAALFFDLDDFKNVNDVHGHLVGSHVLMEMATIILSSVRDTDVVARYGGDEFVVILPESSIEQASLVAGRVREKIERNGFTGGRALKLKLTASFGVAVFPEHAQSPQQLVANADAAMYEAKAAGKNCVRFAERARTLGEQRGITAGERAPGAGEESPAQEPKLP